MAQRVLKIEKVLAKVKELPTLPDIVFKVNEVVNNPNTSATDLEEVIARDQAIAAKILRLVNSAFYGLPGRVDTLTRAIPLLGFSTVRNLVLSLSIFDMISISEFDMKQFWRHSFATSVAARAIAMTDGLPDAESQSLAGLLHDMGKIVLFQSFVKEYAAVQQAVEQKGLTFIQAEQSLHSLDHAEVGYAISERWGFPANIAAAIGHHHNPENAGDFADFSAVTASANVLAQVLDEGFQVDQGFAVVDEACEGFHPLTEKAFKAVERELGKQMQFFENFIDRMEAFRRPSPILQQEVNRIKGKSSVWTLPERK